MCRQVAGIQHAVVMRVFLSPETRASCIISLIYWMTSAVMLRIVTIEKVDSVDIAL